MGKLSTLGRPSSVTSSFSQPLTHFMVQPKMQHRSGVGGGANVCIKGGLVATYTYMGAQRLGATITV